MANSTESIGERNGIDWRTNASRFSLCSSYAIALPQGGGRRNWVVKTHSDLNNGIWDGRQVVSESWIQESAVGRIERIDRVASLRYGYQWWGDRMKVGEQQVSWVAALGFGGQRIYIVPEFDLVAVITAGLYTGTMQDWLPFEIFEKHVLAAVRK